VSATARPINRTRQTRIAKRSNWFVRNRPRQQRAWSRLHASLYQLTHGHFLPRWFAGAPVMVLETVGRKSGKPRSNPVLYLRYGDALVVMASNAGADRTPAWWHNLRDAGEATVVIGGERRRVRPRQLEGGERERLWAEFVEMYPQAEDYTRFTHRRFPLVALEPA
jgi:deazaflavin-dependent oxidoreductase (nitroreductase family)